MILGSMGKNLLNAYTVTIGVTVFGTLLSVLVSAAFAYVLTAVSYTHLDVYKRQAVGQSSV